MVRIRGEVSAPPRAVGVPGEALVPALAGGARGVRAGGRRAHLAASAAVRDITVRRNAGSVARRIPRGALDVAVTGVANRRSVRGGRTRLPAPAAVGRVVRRIDATAPAGREPAAARAARTVRA